MVYSKPQDEALLEVLSAGLEGTNFHHCCRELLNALYTRGGLAISKRCLYCRRQICYLVSKEKEQWTVVTSRMPSSLALLP